MAWIFSLNGPPLQHATFEHIAALYVHGQYRTWLRCLILMLGIVYTCISVWDSVCRWETPRWFLRLTLHIFASCKVDICSNNCLNFDNLGLDIRIARCYDCRYNCASIELDCVGFDRQDCFDTTEHL